MTSLKSGWNVSFANQKPYLMSTIYIFCFSELFAYIFPAQTISKYHFKCSNSSTPDFKQANKLFVLTKGGSF